MIAGASAAAICALALVLTGAGCGDDDGGPTGPGAPQDTFTVPSSAFAAASRMFQTYAAQDVYWYDNTLARNFRYIFANADPNLQALWDSSWTITVEDSTAQHVFDGFDLHGTWRDGAETIRTTYGGYTLGIDTAHQDSAVYYQRVRVLGQQLEVVLPDGTTYQMLMDLNVYVVRGDVAVLAPDQPADSTHWYVRRIEENAEPPAPPIAGSHAVTSITWGGLRGLYSDSPTLERHAR